KARASWAGSGETKDAAIWFDLAEKHGTTEFLGYDTEKAEGQILAVVKDGATVDAAAVGEVVQLMLNQTPFYAESGGQVGDAGTIATEGGKARITDVKKAAGVFVHFAEVTEGKISRGEG